MTSRTARPGERVKRRRSWSRAALALAALLPAAAVMAGAGAASADPAAPTLTCRTSGIVSHTGGGANARSATGSFCTVQTGQYASEQTLAVDSSGGIHLGITASGNGIENSYDGGRTWSKAVPKTASGSNALDPAMGWVERDKTTGRLIASSSLDWSCGVTNGVEGDVMSYSDDNGKTWTVRQGQTCGGGDWGKTFIGPAGTAADKAALAKNNYPNVIYHCTGGTFQNFGRYCWKSLDGGVNYQRTGSAAFSAIPDPNDPTRGPGVCQEGQDFHLLAGDGTVAPDGKVYMVLNACGKLQISTTSDDGDHWSIIDVPVATMRGWFTHNGVNGYISPWNAGFAPRPGQFMWSSYGPIGMAQILSQNLVSDSQGNLYLDWVDASDNNLHYSVSRDRGATWSKPVVIAMPGVVSATMPAIAVREPGHVAVVYWGTRDSDTATSTWDGFVADTHDGLDANPTWTSTQLDQASPTMPNGIGEPIEEAGIDFAPDGSVWAAFTKDTCTPTAQPVPGVPALSCDGDFQYSNTRYLSVVAHLS